MIVVVYKTDGGEIQRTIQSAGDINLDVIGTNEGEAVVEVDRKPKESEKIDPATEAIITDPDYVPPVPPDTLDRNEIPSQLKQDYRNARDVYLTERQNFIDAKEADDVQGQLDALASLAENATVPALDALFQAAMGEEP